MPSLEQPKWGGTSLKWKSTEINWTFAHKNWYFKATSYALFFTILHSRVKTKTYKAASVSTLVSYLARVIVWKICLKQWMRPEAQPGFWLEGGGLNQLSNLGSVLNKLMKLNRITQRAWEVELPTFGQFLWFCGKNSNFNAISITVFTFLKPYE